MTEDEFRTLRYGDMILIGEDPVEKMILSTLFGGVVARYCVLGNPYHGEISIEEAHAIRFAETTDTSGRVAPCHRAE